MKRYMSIAISFLLISNIITAQTKAYVIYNAKGKKVSYKKMMKKITKSDILMFGELHNNPISHWLQYEVTSDLSKKKSLILGAEMIEADDHQTLVSYLNDEIDQEAFDTLARLWPNHNTDYAPLVDFAKEKGIDFIGTNIPRRFANLVYKQGFEALDELTEEEKSWIAPLPITFDPTLPKYQEILEMMGDHGTPELVKAQAIKDATMAHFILSNYTSGHLFIHYNGAYHSDDYEGIVWYLKQTKPSLKYMTITTVSQANVNKLEKDNKRVADFIICVDEDMTTTY